MTTETLRDKTIRLAKEASSCRWDFDSLSFEACGTIDNLETLVRLAQQEALEDAAKEFDHKDAPANGKPWVANALRKMREELK